MKNSPYPLLRVALCLIAFISMTGGGASVRAATLVSNLGETATFVTTVGDFGLGGFGIYSRVAQQFTAGSSTTIDSVTVLLDSGGSTSRFILSAYADSGGNVGSLITDFTGPANPAAGQNTYTGSVAVTSGTNYWIVASVYPFSGQFKLWDGTNSHVQTGQTGWSIGDFRKESDNNGAFWDNYTDEVMMMSISTSTVPEPSGALLCAAALAAGMLRRRRPSKG